MWILSTTRSLVGKGPRPKLKGEEMDAEAEVVKVEVGTEVEEEEAEEMKEREAEEREEREEREAER